MQANCEAWVSLKAVTAYLEIYELKEVTLAIHIMQESLANIGASHRSSWLCAADVHKSKNCLLQTRSCCDTAQGVHDTCA